MLTYKGLKRKIIIIFLILIIIAYSIPSLAVNTVSEANNETDRETIKEIIIPKKSELPIKVVIEDNVLKLKGIPDEPLYNYFHIQIYPSDYSTDAIYDIFRRSSLQDSQFNYNLSSLDDGGYCITIRTAETQSNYYDWSHWMHTIAKNLPFSVIDGEAGFYVLPEYKSNYEKVLKYRSDSVVLDYYKEATKSIQSDNKEIRELAKQITKKAKTDYEKVRLIHDWVAENIWYDYDAANNESHPDQSALTVLRSKKGVCEGYTNLTAALLRSIEIPCKVVLGEVAWNISNKKSEYHVWNEAFVDGRWIFIDTTWDSRNSYSNGEFSEQYPVYDSFFTFDNYFDTSLYTFSLDHKIIRSELLESRFAPTPKTVTAKSSTSSVKVSGEIIPVSAYNINGNNYFKLRDLAFIISKSNYEKQFEIKWDSTNEIINIITSRNYSPVGGELKIVENSDSQAGVENTSPVLLDGIRIQLESYTINGNNYFKLRDIARVINFGVYWDSISNTIVIEPGSDYTPE